MYIIAYCLQVYFDFSGYSDMAVGLGRILGFEFMENFRYPFISRSITEFWRRWHISLGSWFRDYVYIPLGGNRVSRSRWLLNIFIVWMLTGLWHGAAWNFVLWGVYFAAFLIFEKLFLLKKLEQSRILCHIYVLLTVLVSFVIFGAADTGSAAETLGGMSGLTGLPFRSPEQMYYLRSYGGILLIAMIGATPLPKMLLSRLAERKTGAAAINIAEPILLAVLLIISTAYLADGSYNPFLYFRF